MRPFVFGKAVLISAVAYFCVFFLFSAPVQAQSDQTRVVWQLDCESDLSSAQCDQAKSVMLQTLSRAKERHFAGDNSLTQKIRKEGVNFPECFTEGMPCTAGGAFVLDVFNVDAYAKARFGYSNDEWTVALSLYQSNYSTAVKLNRSGPNLPELLQSVAGSLFELESGVEITSTQRDVEVYINKKLVGKLPLKMKTSVGDQVITFKKDGYVSEEWRFTAQKGGMYTKTVELKPEETQLTVLTSAEDAHVFIDGVEWGLANETHNILPGDHKIELKSETHHSYSQDYKVYPGTPQTIQVAMLPNSRSPYEIRHEGIEKYRLSVMIGAHFAWQDMRFADERIDGKKPELGAAGKGVIAGVSASLNYEDKYWGISFLRLDLAGGKNNKLFVGLYPAVLKAHSTISKVQLEASFGLGYSYKRLKYDGKMLTENAFSIDFSLGAKYFFSEEFFAHLSYDLQYDAVTDGKVRNGFTLGVGINFPVWMRTDEVPEVDETVMDDDVLSTDGIVPDNELPNIELDDDELPNDELEDNGEEVE